MAKGNDKSYERSNIEKNDAQTNAAYNNFNSGLQNQKDLNSADQSERQDLRSGYGNQINNSLGQDEVNRLRGIYSSDKLGSITGGGGYGGPTGSTSRLNGVSVNHDSFASGLHIPDHSELGSVNIPTSSAFAGVKGPDFAQTRGGYQALAGLGPADSYGSGGGGRQSPISYDEAGNPIQTADSSNPRGAMINSGNNNNNPLTTGTNRLMSLANDGGYSPDDVKNIQRQSLLDQENNGGYSAKDVSNIRNRSANSASSFYGAIKDQMDRGRRVSGSTSNNAGVDFKLARQAAQQAGQDRVGTEIGLNDSIRQGKFDAASTLSNNQSNMVANRTGNQLNASSILGNQQLSALAGLRGLSSDQSQFDLAKASGLDASDVNNARLGIDRASGMDTFALGSGRLGLDKASQQDNYELGRGDFDFRKASALDSQDAAAASARSSAASNDAATQRWLMENQGDMEKYISGSQQQGAQFGLSGLGNLYGSAYAPTAQNNGFALNGINGQSGANQANRGLSLQNDEVNRSHLMDNIMKGIGVAGSVAGAFGTGGASTALRGLPVAQSGMGSIMNRLPKYSLSR